MSGTFLFGHDKFFFRRPQAVFSIVFNYLKKVQLRRRSLHVSVHYESPDTKTVAVSDASKILIYRFDISISNYCVFSAASTLILLHESSRPFLSLMVDCAVRNSRLNVGNEEVVSEGIESINQLSIGI